ncbi:MAG: FAD-binding oxidoreductase [Deltaproteobacteria bacterium]|nr:FAD-binding oxidoreductase [Deltaproteobacteria bacterium]
MSNSNQLASVLKGIVGESNVIQDSDRLQACAVDGLAPQAIVCPGSAAEISSLFLYANTEKLAIVPRGSGTKMAAGGIPTRIDLVLSTARLNRIVDNDIANLSLTVESGLTLAAVQKLLAGEKKGYFLPLDPPYSEKATLGGIIAANASGPKRFVYGSARDLLLGLKAVTPTGDIVSFGGKTVKNVSGYDMTKLMIGSWGGLGVITEITTKLLPLPEASATVLVSFATPAAAGQFIRKIIHSALLPSAVELLESKAAARLGEKTNYLAAFSLEGVPEAVERQITAIGEDARKEGAVAVKVLKGTEDQAFWIQIRDFALDLTEEFTHPVILRSNFLISRQAAIMESYEAMAQAAGVAAAFIAHAGSGIIYTCLLLNTGASTSMEGIIALIGKLTTEARKQGGNLVVELCPRKIKETVSVWGEPRSDYVVMRRLKEKMDPAGILNPGRLAGGI